MTFYNNRTNQYLLDTLSCAIRKSSRNYKNFLKIKMIFKEFETRDLTDKLHQDRLVDLKYNYYLH